MQVSSLHAPSRCMYSSAARSAVTFARSNASLPSHANPWIASSPSFLLCFRPSPSTHIQARAASHKAQGVANGGKNGPGKRLGAKKTGEQYVIPGNIIFRQRGTQWYPGDNVGMGRDHTIFARQAGYVKYYADPEEKSKRKYIGVVFERDDTLPQPANAARKRRLGMVAVPITTGMSDGLESGMDRSDADQVLVGKGGTADVTTIRVPSASKRKSVPDKVFSLRPGYSYRESNWEIGRAAERAKVKVRQFKPGDRFAAWRKANARKAANADRRSMKRKGNKKK